MCESFLFYGIFMWIFLFSLQYEMIQLYIDINDFHGEKEEDDDLTVYLLDAAIHYFNGRFKTNLILNNNYKNNADNDSDVIGLLTRIAESKKSPKMSTFDGFRIAPAVQVLTKKVSGNKEAVKCGQSCGGFCYGSGCRAAIALRQRYYGASIFFIYTLDGPKCFLCDKKITQGGLNNHFNQDCQVFKRPQATAFF